MTKSDPGRLPGLGDESSTYVIWRLCSGALTWEKYYLYSSEDNRVSLQNVLSIYAVVALGCRVWLVAAAPCPVVDLASRRTFRLIQPGGTQLRGT